MVENSLHNRLMQRMVVVMALVVMGILSLMVELLQQQQELQAKKVMD